MLSYPKPTSPVVPGLQSHEITVEKGTQPGYTKIPSLRANTADGRILSRWTFTDEERMAIAAGADLYIQQWLFRSSVQPPISLMVADQLGTDYVRRDFDLAPDLPAVSVQEPIGALAADIRHHDPQLVAALLDAGHLIVLDKLFNHIPLSEEDNLIVKQFTPTEANG